MKKTLKRILSLVLSLVLLAAPLLSINSFAAYEEITEDIPLLNEKGYLNKTGWCFQNKFAYDRSKIGANATRIKEWDFYQISNDKYCVQITIADISLGGAVTVGFFDLETGEEYSTMMLNLFTFGRMNLSKDAMAAHSYSFKRGNFDLELDVTKEKRTIKFTGKKGFKDFKLDITLDMLPEHDSLIMAVPFNKEDQFYYNQKVNCMAATGTVEYGDINFEFKGKEDNSYCVLDWGRGVWPFHEDWWWGNGSTTLSDGNIFGFEIGWGFGNTDDGIENAVFYNGEGTKIGKITLVNEEEVMKDWTGQDWIFKSEDGKFEMTMTPTFDHYTMLRFIFIGNICHQVFGKWNGTVTLDDGTKLEIKDMVAFCEHSDNMW